MGDRVPDRFHSLDSLRGVAALAVVLFHWQHFFFQGTTPQPIEYWRLPFPDLFFVFYTKGRLGVELFFSLSGFIFYWLYASRIDSRRISPLQFFALRFSRLYPLHFVTLLFVAAAQWIHYAATGSFWVYAYNDTKHFLLQLGLASAWGFQEDHSFNGPIWSVSIEVLLYAAFFALCRFLPVRLATVLVATVAGYLLQRYLPEIGRGVASFFLGAISFMAYKRITEAGWTRALWKPTVIAVAVAWAIALLVFTMQTSFALPSPRSIPAGRYIAWLGRNVFVENAVIVLFPATILALALAETVRGHLGRRISLLGDISYSTYLLHFPLQITAIGLAGLIGFERDIFYGGITMAAFFVTLIAISLGSYHYFERPVQGWLRHFSGALLSPKLERNPESIGADTRSNATHRIP